jgi:dTDP-4-dehydrorhamnose reductase
VKVLVTGAQGQLGLALRRTCPKPVELVALSRSELDITERDQVLACLREQQPDVVINCAAYTAVDGAETEPDLALEINGEGVANLGRAAQLTGTRVIHVSTDFVFDGSAAVPYCPDHETRPLGMYGHSKLAGENRLQELLPLGSVVVRTAWLYSGDGSNFVKTMLRLMAERDALPVVADQQGSPTWTVGLAAALWGFCDHPEAHGVYHWTDNGSCSWYEFACAIQEQALARGLLQNHAAITPISTSEYPTPAMRPAYSVLDCSRTHRLLGMSGTDWREQLRNMLGELGEL